MCPGLKSLRCSVLAWAVVPLLLRADPGDVENSREYPGFTRMPGYLITDYDEDNPADFDFPVARPLAEDADHMESVHVTGHRYVIRYEYNSGTMPSLLDTQMHYEKLAAAAGFTAEKTGAVGDVTETFHRATGGHDIWVYLEPSVRVNVLTIVESKGKAPPPPLAVTPQAMASTPSAVPPLMVKSPPTNEEAFYLALMTQGHVVLPLTFLPGKPDLDADSQPVIDRVVAMMKAHPDLDLEIDGHTDDTGDPRVNQRLSEDRARTVRAMIIAGHIERSRLTAVGMGGSQPLGDNNTAEGRELNRRIELVLQKFRVLNAPEKNSAEEDSFEPGTSNYRAPAPNGTNYYPNTGNR